MKYIEEEREISVKELFFYIIYKWRSILFSAIVTVITTMLINVKAILKYKDVLGISVVITAFIKHLIIVTFLVVAVIVTVYALLFLFSDTIKSPREFSRVCGVPVVGCIGKEGKRNIIDKILRKLNGVKYKVENNSLYEQCIAKVIEKTIGTAELSEERTIVIMSSYSEKCAEAVAAGINKKMVASVKISAIGDVDILPTSIDAIENADYVLLAECQEKSKYFEFEQTMCKIDRFNKKVIGVVLIDVDAI